MTAFPSLCLDQKPYVSHLPGDMMLCQLLSSSCQKLHFQNYIWQSVERAKNSPLQVLSFLLHILSLITKSLHFYQRKFSNSYKINPNLSWSDRGSFFFSCYTLKKKIASALKLKILCIIRCNDSEKRTHMVLLT